MKIMGRTGLLWALFAAVLFMVPVSHAMAPKESVMKTPDFMPAADFEAKTQIFKSAPSGNKVLAYQIRLPKDWVLEEATAAANTKEVPGLNKNVLERLARYVSPARKHRRSFVHIESQKLDYEIGVRNWFLNYIDSTGVTLETINSADDGKDYVEAAYVALEGDITYGVRVKAYINGSYVIMARYYVPLELFLDEKVMQAQGIDSFHLAAKKVNRIEERRTHGFLDQAYFDFPISWTLRAPKVVAVERMRAMIYTPGVDNKLTGQVNINLTSKFIDTTMAKEIADYRKRFNLTGYKIGNKIEAKTLPVHGDITTTSTEIYTLTPDKNFMLGYELWVTIMESQDYYYIVSMITPARKDEFYRWARNVKAYEIVVGTTRQFDDSIDSYQFSGEKQK